METQLKASEKSRKKDALDAKEARALIHSLVSTNSADQKVTNTQLLDIRLTGGKLLGKMEVLLQQSLTARSRNTYTTSVPTIAPPLLVDGIRGDISDYVEQKTLDPKFRLEKAK